MCSNFFHLVWRKTTLHPVVGQTSGRHLVPSNWVDMFQRDHVHPERWKIFRELIKIRSKKQRFIWMSDQVDECVSSFVIQYERPSSGNSSQVAATAFAIVIAIAID